LSLSAAAPAVSLKPIAEPPANPDSAFSLGLAAYDTHNYAEARRNFSAAARTATSFALEYNLGNACYQAGDPPAAILHYLRALAIDPRDPDARQNLALARAALAITVPDPSFLEHVTAFLNVDAWAWLLTFFGWAALSLLLLPRLFRWRGATPWLLFTLALLLSATAVAALVTAHRHARDGVVLHADTQIKLSPTADSQAVGTLAAGDVGETLDEHNGYYYIRASDGRLGWVNSLNFAPIYQLYAK
jgi:tetratricopeptide (TPR) repeat protein